MSGEPLAYQYLMQTISVAVQRDNAVVMHGTSSPDDFDLINSQGLLFPSACGCTLVYEVLL